jgi:hypothetical protein
VNTVRSVAGPFRAIAVPGRLPRLPHSPGAADFVERISHVYARQEALNRRRSRALQAGQRRESSLAIPTTHASNGYSVSVLVDYGVVAPAAPPWEPIEDNESRTCFVTPVTVSVTCFVASVTAVRTWFCRFVTPVLT